MTMFERVIRDVNTEFKTALARVRATLRPGSKGKMRHTRSLDLAQLEERLLLSAAPPGNPALMPTGGDGAGSAGTTPRPQDSATFIDSPDGPARTSQDAQPLDTAITPDDGSSDHRALTGATSLVINGHAANSDSQRHEIIFVDASVQDHELLITDLQQSEGDGIERQIVLLDADRDGVAQVGEVLASTQGIDAIHIVSHGMAGSVQLGSGWLRAADLPTYADALRSWSDSLSPDADLLFYGCDVAASADGAALLDAISSLTGADVAASEDATGYAALGGDWDLEHTVGAVETPVAVRAELQGRWHSLLGLPLPADLTVDTTQDVVDGDIQSVTSLLANRGVDGFISLREAIIATNNSAGANTIRLLSGTYTLAVTGGNEDVAATGDLDVRGDLEIIGDSSASTIIDGGGQDRVFDVHSGVTAKIAGVTVQNGGNVAHGGGFQVQAGGQLKLSESIVRNNTTAITSGAGIYNDGALSLTDVWITGNSSTLSGGGLYNFGDATLNRVTISGNQSSFGGAVYQAILGTGNLSLTNVTVSGNTATTTGGAVYAWESMDIVNSTFTQNSAAGVGGILKTGGTHTIDVQNTIIAGNTGTTPDLQGAFVSSGNNIIGNATGSTGFVHGINGDQVGSGASPINPLLSSTLQDNGGFTPTHALLAGSPAINSGTAAGAPATDQRGYARSGATDIGAYEFLANTLVVDTTSDVVDGNTSSVNALLASKGADGRISLREAIIATNNTANNGDLIQFNIAGAGPHTINLTSALPTITGAVIIDGWSEPDFAGTPVIELNGTSAGGGADGLRVTAGGTTIRGLVINRFSGDAIELNGGSGNTIVGNYLGTNVSGTSSRANSGGGVNIVSSANNFIGGITAAERNVISGNLNGAINIDGVASLGNLVQGNYIGLNAAGTTTLTNNGFNGVWIGNGAKNNTVGGPVSGAGNVISGQNEQGIEIQGNGSTGNVIQGNYIGTDTAGTAVLGNGGQGIALEGAVNTLIGGIVPGAENVIGGNTGGGIVVAGSLANGNVIEGNFIGTDFTGTLNLANTGPGIHFANSFEAISGGGDNNIVGGTLPGAGNHIAFNTGDGIWVESTTALGNSILGNSIYSNGQLGIDLEGNNVTANDAGDIDSGANRLQNFPVLNAAFASGSSLSVSGILNSTASRTFRVEFFGSAAADASGYGEAERYLGFTNVTTNNSGNAAFYVTFTATVTLGDKISATATDLTTGDTSEFAQNTVASAGNQPPINTVPGPQTTNEDTSLVFSNANGNAISISDADAGVSPVEVTLAVTNGTTTLSGTGGLTFTAGDGLSDATMTFRGTVANINTALNGVVFSPTTDYNGNATLTLSTLDATLVSLNLDAALKGRYTFDNTGLLGQDTSPSGGNNGTVVNAAAAVDGTRGNVLSLNAASGADYVRMTGHFGNPSNVTLAAWVNLTTAPTNGAEVISLGDSAALRLDDNGNLKGYIYNGSTWKTVTYGTTLAGTGWHHVAYTFDDDGNVQKLYLDGTQVAAVTETGSISYTLGANSYIGTHANGSTLHNYTGKIDDVRIYNRALGAGEIANLASDLSLVDADTVAITIAAANDAPVNITPVAPSTNEETTLVLSAANGNALSISDDSGDNPIEITLTATNGTISADNFMGAEFRANTTTLNDQMAPDTAVAPDGRYVVAWQSKGQDNIDGKFGIYAQMFAADGTPLTGEILVNTNTIDDQTAPAVAIDANGDFVVVWQHRDTNVTKVWDIYARTFDDTGTAITNATRVNATTTGDQTSPTVGMDAAGNFVVAWQSKAQDNLDGKLGVYSRVFNLAAQAQTGELLVNTTTANDQGTPDIAVRSTGEFLVVWQSMNQDGSGTGIYGQRFSAAGAKQGGEFIINTTTSNNQSDAAVDYDVNGNFVVAWRSNGQDNNPPEGNGAGIFAQRFNAAGVKLGGEFGVNTTVSSNQVAPEIAVAADGRFTIAWQSSGQDHADGKDGIYAQSFNSDGSLLGEEFRVNTTTADQQQAPAIGTSASGQLLVVWESDKQDGSGEGIYGQRLMPPGAISFAAGDGLDDVTMTLTGTVSDINVFLDGMRFAPTANYFGPATLTINTDDQGNTGAGGPLADSDVININVVAVNDAPSVGVPGAQSAVEGFALEFSASEGNAISFADIDAFAGSLRVTLSVTHGTLTLGSTTGITFVNGGNGQSSMSFTGVLADLNNAVDGLIYTSNSTYSGLDTLSVAINDQGNIGGGPLVDSDSVLITVAAYNDPPVHSLPASQTVIENGTLAFSPGNGNPISVSDEDAGTADIQTTLQVFHGRLTLSTMLGLTFTEGDGTADSRMTFRGQVSEINAALNGLTFQPFTTYAGPETLRIVTNDLGQSGPDGSKVDSDVLEITVTANATNAAPVHSVPGPQITVEEVPLAFSTNNGNSISVVDDAAGSAIQVTLTATNGTVSLSSTTGNEVRVNSQVTDDQLNAVTAMAPNGDYVVVWQSLNQDGDKAAIFAQRYDQSGTPIDAEFPVNTTTDEDQTDPAIAIADDGSFVVVWTSKDQDGDNTGVFGQRFAANGTKLGVEFQINTTITHEQQNASVAMDASGNFVVVWQSKDQDGSDWGIYAQRFAANGTAVGSEFRVNTTTAGEQMAPSVAMDADGDFVVTWQGDHQDGDHRGIFARRYGSSGAPAGGEFQVNTISFEEQTAPDIAMDDAGNFVIVWESKDLDYPDDKYGIYGQRFDASGNPIGGGQFLVNSKTPDEQRSPSIAMDSTGDFVVSWQSKRQDNPDGNYGIFAQRFNADGTPRDTELQVNTYTAKEQTLPSVAMGEEGRFVVVWQSKGQDAADTWGVYGQQYKDIRNLTYLTGDGTSDAIVTFQGDQDEINDALDGLIFTPNTDFHGLARLQIDTNDLGHTGAGGPKTDSDFVNIAVTPLNDAPTVSVPVAQSASEGVGLIFTIASGNAISIADVDAGNNPVLVTLTATNGTMTLSNTTGLTFSQGDGTADASMVITGTVANVNAALDGMEFTAPSNFAGDASVYIHVDDQGNSGPGGAFSDSAAVQITVVPDATNDSPVLNIPGAQRTPVNTPLALSETTGNNVSITDDAGSNPIQVTIAVTSGTVSLTETVGPEVRVNTETNKDQQDSSLAMTPSGEYVVVWVSQDQDGSGDGIFGQRFDAAGFKIGPEFLVNSTTANSQIDPVVAINANGDFVVAWTSSAQDGDGQGINARRFDSDGSPAGDEFLVNTAISGNQIAPAIAIDDSGGFVVAWQGDDGSGQGILAQRFDAQGVAQGAEFVVNTTTSSDQKNPAIAIDSDGDFVIAWDGVDSNGRGVFAQRFDRTGNLVGGEFQVNTSTAGNQELPAISMDATGNFVVAWEGIDGSGDGVFARRYNNAGTALGGEIAVNATTAGNQMVPTVSMNDSGSFVVAWQGDDANGRGTFGQRFNAAGVRVDNELLLNVTTASDQTVPVVGLANDGTFVASWTSSNQDGNAAGVYAQHFTVANAVSYTTGDGTNDALLVFTGSLADVNALIDGMVFTPTTGFVGVAKIQVTVNDLGNTGGGPPLSAGGTLDIVVGNGPRVNLDLNNSSGTGDGGFTTVFFPLGTPVNIADADAVVDDPNSANLTQLTVRITNRFDGGFETLSANTAGTSIVALLVGDTLTLTGPDTPAHFQQVLRTVKYGNSSASPNLTTRVLQVTANDGVLASNQAFAYVNLISTGIPVGPISDSDGAADAIVENAANGATVGLTAFASDLNDTVTYSLDNNAGGRFMIDAASGVVSVANGTLLDREAAASHNITVRATSTDTSFSTRVFTIAVLPLNDNAPVFTSSGTASINENQTIVQTLTATDADLPAQTITFGITGGADAAKFAINGAKQLVFVAAPDFETPTDAGADNVYDVQVTANDGNGASTTQAISVTVNDLFEGNVLVVDTTADIVDGDVTSIANLLLDRGLDGRISLREAILATNNTPNGGTPDEIRFSMPDLDVGHLYYRDDGIANSLSLTVSTTLDDASITDFDADYPYTLHSWFRINLNPADVELDITDAVIIDGYSQAGATHNTLSVGHDANLRIELTSIGADGDRGINVEAGGGGSTIRGLAINGFDFSGILTDPGADGVMIQGNYIGTDITGTIDLGNGDSGVQLRSGGNLVGGSNLQDRNVISGNDSRGVVTYTFGPIETGNVVDNNYIGVDATGVRGLGNDTAGVQVWNQDGIQIVGNVIAGNFGDGVWLRPGGTHANTVIQGNLVGVGADGAAAVGNSGAGIRIESGATNTIVGGTLAGQANTIAHNGSDGVEVAGGIGASIRSNSIFDNGGLGIDLVGVGGPDANDAMDTDGGPNTLQNYPVLSSAAVTGAAITIDGALHSTPNMTGMLIDFYWSITGDGSSHGEAENYIGSTTVNTDGSGDASFSATFAAASVPPGSFITATATNPAGNTSEFSLNVEANTPPAITSSSTQAIAENQTIVHTLTASDSDLPAQTITFSITGGVDATQFGINGSNQLVFLTAPDFESPTDAFLDNVYQVQVTADDGNGGTDTQLVSVTVTPVNDNSPVITSSATASVPENTTPVLTVTSTDADLPTQSLTYSISGGADAALFTIDSASGVLVFNSDPDYESPADADLDNVYEITVQVSDGTFTDTQAIAVTVVNGNELPVATDDSFAVVEDTPLTVPTAAGVLANDGDVDGDPLTVVLVSGPASAASFSLNADGSFSYTPNAGFSGSDSFTYRANDGFNNSNLATVTITVSPVNDAPVITSPNAVSVNENTAAVVTVTSTDADGDPPSYSIVGGADAARFTIDGTTGALSFVVPPDFEVPTDTNADNIYDVQVTADDGLGGSASQLISVTVSPLNDNLPIITSANSANVAENTSAVLTVSANDADLPAQSITYSISGGADAVKFVIDSATGSLVFVTAPDFDSPTDADADNIYEVQVTADDGNGGTAIQLITVNVTPLNDNLPIITSANSVSVAENTGAVLPVSASDADLPAQSITYSISGGADAGKFTINASNGALTFVDAPDFENPTDSDADNVYEVQVTAADNAGGAASQLIRVTVTAVNEAPVATADNYVTDQRVNLNIAAPGLLANDSDPDGLPLLAVVQAGPSHGTLVANPDGSFVYIPDANFSGTDSFTYRANNGLLLSAAVTVRVTVLPQFAPEPDPEPRGDEPPPAAEPPVQKPPPLAQPPSDSLPPSVPPTGGGSGGQREHRATDLRSSQGTATLNSAVQPLVAPNNNLALDSVRDRGVFRGRNTGTINSAETRIVASLGPVIDCTALSQDLASLKDLLSSSGRMEGLIVHSAAASAIGLSVGYVFWIIRGGYLVTSLLSSLPAWQLIDPLPVLESLSNEEDSDDPADRETLASILEEKQTERST